MHSDWKEFKSMLIGTEKVYWYKGKDELRKIRVVQLFGFYILLTVYLGIILVNNQPDALFQCIYLFHLSTCFEQPSAHHQENQLYQYSVLYIYPSV